MGTLDDAIRQHLELKRRSGAADNEVQRLESEAFGPVGKAAQPPQTAAPIAPEPPAEAELPPPPVGPPAYLPGLPEVPVDPARPAAPAPASPPPPRASGSWLEDEPDEVPFGDALDHRRPPSQSTSEFTAAEAHAAGGKPPADYVAPDEEGEDLLEETPEFLQETPEHDRLWFEQKPPRDFDFDE